MSDNKPTISIELAAKNGDKKIKVCALWKSKNGYAGSYSAGNIGWSVYDKDKGESVAITKLVLADGRTIALADYWTNATHWEEKNGAGGAQAEPRPIASQDKFDMDDIPF